MWWENITDGYRFCDGDTDHTSHPEGPDLLHFRSATLKDVVAQQTAGT